MEEENKIKSELEEKFAYLSGVVKMQRNNRVFLDVALDKFEEVFSYAIKQMGFEGLSTITGMDLGDSFSVIYHLSREGKAVLNLRVSLKKDDPELNSVTAAFPNADIYERELMDLLGIRVNGLAKGHRYPLPDNWPKDSYPLRKDWKQDV